MSVSSTRHLVIAPAKGFSGFGLSDLWSYRELLLFLAWRDVKVRYAQTIFGVAWAVAQPVLTVVVFTVVFGRLAKLPSQGVPYPLFAYAGLLPWQLFASSLSTSSNSLVGSQNLITKVYFPRLVIPLAAVLEGLVDFAVSFCVLLALMVYFGYAPTWRILVLPVFIVFAQIAALSVGLWLAALNVQYRDVRFTVPFLIQLWMYASPVGYSSTLVPERFRALFALNPMVGVIDTFRWSLLGRGAAPTFTVLPSALAVLVLLIGGLAYFRRTERTFADRV